MPHRKDIAEERAIARLREIIAMSDRDRDALPGSAVKHMKEALRIMVKRRKVSHPSEPA